MTPATPPPYWTSPAATAAPAPPRIARTVALVATAALVAGAAGGVVGATVAEESAAPTATDGMTSTRASFDDGTVSAVAARVLPSVVSIEVRSGRGGGGSGSGVVLDDEGPILTNDHVVEPGVGGAVSVVFDDGQRVDAEIVGRDPVTDLAVLDVDGVDDLQPIEPGRSRDVRVGDAVIAIGSPLGLSGTVTTGIVSALGRTVRTSPEAPLLGGVQTDAAINPGNSGGALVDAQGRLIGINTAISSTTGGSVGLGFAIPAGEARSVADELIRTGRATHPSLGVAATTMASEDGGPRGARIEDAAEGSTAADAGLRTGDVIVAVDEVRVDSVDELVLALRERGVGQRVVLTYLRDGSERFAPVVLADRTT